MTYDPVHAVINALSDAGKSPKKQGKEFKAVCPAHADKSPSLQIGYGDKGATVFCQGGCKTEDVLAAIGMKMEQLFEEPLDKDNQMPLHAAVPGAEGTYIYEDETGRVLFRVEKHRTSGGGKRFLQARPDPAAPGDWIYNLGNTRRVPYRLPAVLAAAKEHELIFIVEGEKDVHALEMQGLVATTNPGGAGKFKREYSEFFAGADVVVLPDNDQTGESHALTVVEHLSMIARSVSILRLPGLPDKGDVSDWLAAAPENTGDALLALCADLTPLHTNRPVIFNAEGLMREEFPDVVMAVPGVIAEGATFLVGAPKIGKSWMVLGLALAIARGIPALGTIDVEEGKVLYLALEDTPRRLQRRLTVMIGQTEGPKNLEFACLWPRLNAGGLDQLEDWLKDNQDARMVVIDTWAKVKGGGGPEQESMYQADYAAVSQVKALADLYGVAIVMVHHQRKAADGDPLNTVAGSTGLTGAADATVILTRTRGSEEGTLYVTGRDVEESKSLLSFDAENGAWLWLGEAEDVEETRTEDSIIKLLASSQDPMGPKEVSQALDMKEGTAKWLLSKMCQEGKIQRIKRGHYTATLNGQSTGNNNGALPPGVTVVQGWQPPMPGVGGPTVPAGLVAVDEAEEGPTDEEIAALMDAAEFGPLDDDED